MVKLWQSLFGHRIKPDGSEKPLDHGQIYCLVDKVYPTQPYSQIYFCDDTFRLQAYILKICYNTIKNIQNTSEKEVRFINRVSCIKETKGKKANLVL